MGKFELVELSIRIYRGLQNGCDTWEMVTSAVGVKIEDDVYDYKTGEKYNYVERDENGAMKLHREEAIVGEVYAVYRAHLDINVKGIWVGRKVDKYIENSPLFEEEYKELKRCKKLIK